MRFRTPMLAVALALAAAPAAHAAPPSACPSQGTASGWAAISASGWPDSAEGAVYETAPQYDEAALRALLQMIDVDGDDVICRKFGVLTDGRAPFQWPGYTPISFIDDLRPM